MADSKLTIYSKSSMADGWKVEFDKQTGRGTIWFVGIEQVAFSAKDLGFLIGALQKIEQHIFQGGRAIVSADCNHCEWEADGLPGLVKMAIRRHMTETGHEAELSSGRRSKESE